MKIKATPNVKGGIIESTISIDNFGSADLSAEEEKELFEDYKIVVDYGKILFSRYVMIDGHNNPVIVESPQTDGQESSSDDTSSPDNIILAMPIGESYELDADFELKYSVDISALGDSYKSYNNIKDNICLAKAMCLTFEDVIISYIQEQIAVAKTHKDNFETVRYYVI